MPSDYRLSQMVEILNLCLHRAEVFSRDVPNKSLIERTEIEEKDGSRWAILAAGLSDEVAERYFKPGSERVGHATIPLRVSGGGHAEILMQMRPIEWPNPCPGLTRFVAHYAPGEKIPFVEIAKGRISLDFDIPDGKFGLFNLRWEVDAREAGKPPLEDWLRSWWRTLEYNPRIRRRTCTSTPVPKHLPSSGPGDWRTRGRTTSGWPSAIPTRLLSSSQLQPGCEGIWRSGDNRCDLNLMRDCSRIAEHLRLAVELAALHHELDLAQGLDVAGRVALDGGEVGQQPGLTAPRRLSNAMVLAATQVGRAGPPPASCRIRPGARARGRRRRGRRRPCRCRWRS